MTALDDWLARGAGFDCEYAGGLSNHLPMLLVAWQKLGADDDTLATLAERYAARLQPAPAAMAWPAGDAWTARLGQAEAWPAYRSLFVEWLKAEYAGEVLAQVLPVLMRGIGAAAFHGPIRTAYAVRSAHRQELADALAYWASRWLPLGGGGATRSAVRPDESDPARLLPQLRVPRRRHGPIWQAMADAASQPGFDALVGRLAIDEATLPRLAGLAATVMVGSGGNFVVLHLLTSAHAMGELLPFLDDEPARLAAIGHWWRAYAAAAGASQAHPRPEAVRRQASWEELSRRALASGDDHLPKLVWSCRELERTLGAGPWRAAASAA
jgi:hypothetical protein